MLAAFTRVTLGNTAWWRAKVMPVRASRWIVGVRWESIWEGWRPSNATTRTRSRGPRALAERAITGASRWDQNRTEQRTETGGGADAFALAPQPSGLTEAHPPVSAARTTAPSVATSRHRSARARSIARRGAAT